MFNLNLMNILSDNTNFEERNVNLSTDSRSYAGEEIFFCLCGDNFDGFNYIESVLAQGCEIVVFRQTESNLLKMEGLSKVFEKVSFLAVDSPLKSLQELATARINQFKRDGGIVFGITGSNGKTTTKEMLTAILKYTFGENVHSTKGNFNNHIGVPLTILSASASCRYMVVEMGANHVGEIETLCEISQPEFGIISSIGAAHIGLFGSIENIFKEKTTLYKYVLEKGTKKSIFVVNGDDEYLGKLSPNDKLIRFGQNKEVSTEFLDGHVKIGDSIILNNYNIQERYNLNNLISALLLCINTFPQYKEKFIEAANTYKIPSLNRSEWINKNNKLIFLDAYNANPTSMESSLTSFSSSISKKNISLTETLFILGDMNELGDYTESEHKRIGELIKQLGASQVAFVGQYAKYYHEGYTDGAIFLEKSSLEREWPKLIKNCRAIFIKASRSLQLESLIDIT